jgi:hypothetical protein
MISFGPSYICLQSLYDGVAVENGILRSVPGGTYIDRLRSGYEGPTLIVDNDTLLENDRYLQTSP